MDDLREHLRPIAEQRVTLAEARETLREQMRELDALITAYEKVLRAGGLSVNGDKPKEKKEQAPPSEDIQQRALAYVNTHGTTTSAGLAAALDISTSYASKTLTFLRDSEQIRLLRVESAHPSGKGRKPVYGPWAVTDARD